MILVSHGEKRVSWLDTKYPYVVHAEPNAILNSTSDLHQSTMYVTLFPCNECAKLIIQSGIKKLVYYEDKYKDTESIIASKKMLDASGVKYLFLMMLKLILIRILIKNKN